MRLFLIFAAVAVIAMIILALMRPRTRITTIEHRRERDSEDDRDA